MFLIVSSFAVLFLLPVILICYKHLTTLNIILQLNSHLQSLFCNRNDSTKLLRTQMRLQQFFKGIVNSSRKHLLYKYEI